MIIKKMVDGNTQYRLNGELHRPNGPATIFHYDGQRAWFLYGKHHRYYGPRNWRKDWAIHGKLIKCETKDFLLR